MNNIRSQMYRNISEVIFRVQRTREYLFLNVFGNGYKKRGICETNVQIVRGKKNAALNRLGHLDMT